MEVKQLKVLMHGRHVGTLASTPTGEVAFQYSSEWIADGFSISPLSLPLEDRLFIAKHQPFDGVFGILSDSMPDGWGRLLVDRMLREQRIDPNEIGSLERLSIVGQSGMGALEYLPETILPARGEMLDLDQIAAECAQFLKTDKASDLDELFLLGGSSGGARPKIFTQIDNEGWIVKFPSSHDPANIGKAEYELAQKAIGCGIEMPEVRLMPSQVCSGYFATKRFDRVLGEDRSIEKVHMASVGALLEASHRIPSLDYDQLLKLTLILTDDLSEVERMLRLMVFNVYAGNRDDHAKNFSFLYTVNDGWRLSPAYDLTENSGFNGEHSTTVNGKGKGITDADIREVGLRAGLSAGRVSAVLKDVQSVFGKKLS